MNDVNLPIAGITSIDGWSGGIVGFFTNRLRRFDLDGQPVGASVPVPSPFNALDTQARLNCDAQGGSVLVWAAATNVSGTRRLLAQRFSPTLTALGDPIEVGVSDRARGDDPPDINVNADGSFTVAWIGDAATRSILLRKYDSQGQALGEAFSVFTHSAYAPQHLALDGNDAGKLAMVWSQQQAPQSKLMLELIEPSGEITHAPEEVTGFAYPDVKMAPNGKVAVGWGASIPGLVPAKAANYFRLYASTGEPVTEVTLAMMSANVGPGRLAVDETSTFTMAIDSYDLTFSGGVFARRFDSDGNLVSGVFRVNDVIEGNQRCTSVVSVGQRTFFSWSAFFNPTASEGTNAFMRGVKMVSGVAPQLISKSFDVDRIWSAGISDRKTTLSFNTPVWFDLGPGQGTFTNETAGASVDPFFLPTQNNLQTSPTISRSSPYTYTDGNWHLSINRFVFSDRWGTALEQDVEFDFFVLAGDANRDRRVDTLDFNILAHNFGGSGKVFTKGDFDYSQQVNSTDFNILLSNYGRFLPAPMTVAANLFAAPPGVVQCQVYAIVGLLEANY